MRMGSTRLRGHKIIWLLAALAIAACGGINDGFATDPFGQIESDADRTVTIKERSFSPQSITVAPGTTVSWVWSPCSSGEYTTCPTHNVTFDDGSNISSGNRDGGEFTRVFNVAGTFQYHCKIHGAVMSGTRREVRDDGHTDRAGPAKAGPAFVRKR